MATQPNITNNTIHDLATRQDKTSQLLTKPDMATKQNRIARHTTGRHTTRPILTGLGDMTRREKTIYYRHDVTGRYLTWRHNHARLGDKTGHTWQNDSGTHKTLRSDITNPLGTILNTATKRKVTVKDDTTHYMATRRDFTLLDPTWRQNSTRPYKTS